MYQIPKNEGEYNMPGWADALNETTRDASVTHLAVYKINHKGYAVSTNFMVDKQELNAIVKSMASQSGTRIVVNKTTYAVHSEEISDLHIHATGPLEEDGTNKETEVVWIGKTNEYVIIGVAGTENNVSCEAEVFQLTRHLTSNEAKEQEVKDGDTDPEDVQMQNIYGNVGFH